MTSIATLDEARSTPAAKAVQELLRFAASLREPSDARGAFEIQARALAKDAMALKQMLEDGRDQTVYRRFSVSFASKAVARLRASEPQQCVELVEQALSEYGRTLLRCVAVQERFSFLSRPLLDASNKKKRSRNNTLPRAPLTLYVVYLASAEEYLSNATEHARNLRDCETVGEVVVMEARAFYSRVLHGDRHALQAHFTRGLFEREDTGELERLLCDTRLSSEHFSSARLLKNCTGHAEGLLVRGGHKEMDRALVATGVRVLCDAVRCAAGAPPAGDQSDLFDGRSTMLSALLHDDMTSFTTLHDAVQYACGTPGETPAPTADALASAAKSVLARVRANRSAASTETEEETQQCHQIVGEWLGRVRQNAYGIGTSKGSEDQSKARAVLETIGEPILSMVERLWAERAHVMCVRQTGSHMYGLETPTSDRDYAVVFARAPEKLCASTEHKWEHELYESPKGVDVEVEGNLIEVRRVCEMAALGTPGVFELMSEGRPVAYESASWIALKRECAAETLNERTVSDYLGWLSSHIGWIEQGKFERGGARERKAFYHVLHKLWIVEQIARGAERIRVTMEGSERESVLRVRQGPFVEGDGEGSREALLQSVHMRLSAVRERLVRREWRLKESGDNAVFERFLVRLRKGQL